MELLILCYIFVFFEETVFFELFCTEFLSATHVFPLLLQLWDTL